MKRFPTYLIAYMSITLAGLLMFLASQPALIFSAPSASGKVSEAWQRAQDVGIYEYQTDIVQTTWPTERLENVGLSSKQERVYLEGEVNRREDFMQLAMWSEGGSVESGQGAIEVKIEDGKALGRVGQGAWEEVDDATNFLTPENDSLSYLVAAKNVTEMGQETRAGVAFTRYSFEVDGPTFAQYMREQMEEGLRRKGQLPARMNLDLMSQYVEMTATGELWVNADGLPLRQIMHMQFPAASSQSSPMGEAGMEWYEAQITTDFSNWGQDVQGAAFLGLPRLLREHDWPQTGFSVGLLAGLMGLITWLIIHREKKGVYRAFVTATIVAMVAGPLMNSHQVYAFSERQQARVADYEQAQERQETLQEVEAKLNESQFDPTVNPLVQAQHDKLVENQPTSPPTNQPTSQPTHQLTNPPDLDGAARAQAAASSTDTDGDGLSDEIELKELGTNPKHVDTDGDLISDKREVEGFKDASGRQWYLNPLGADSNGDSQLDMQECGNLVDVEAQADGSFKLVSPTGSRCQDTDADGTPDVFDFDDDGDGVPDSVDSAPTTVLAGGKDANGGLTSFTNNTLNFKLDQFEKDKPLLVDIQLRPTKAKHLWYRGNVLDWPANDKKGQVQRVFTDTFGASGKEANGDMRLLPMLEIEIPFQAGHYGNLPVKSGYSGGITASTPLSSWLDQSKVDSYGMSVRKKDDKGTLLVHVPLNVVREQADDSPVALGGRIYYQPHSSSFGSTHNMRLVWVIRAKVDSCKPPANVEYDDHCKNLSNWTKAEQVIHTYEDEWYVTGLSVREEHGIDVAAVFENPSHAGGNAHYDNYLWHLADGLQRSFLAGRKGADGKRDFTFSEIKRRFDKDSNGSVSNTQRWNIPNQALQVKTYRFAEEGETTTIPMTHTKQILTTHFPSASAGQAVTLLFAREEQSRMAFLGTNTPTAPAKNKGAISANSLTLSFAATQKEVLTGMMWAPFKHKGSGTWEPYTIETYSSKLESDFQQALSSESDATARAGRVLLAKSYYLALLSGNTNSIVKRGERLITIGTPATDALLAAKDPKEALMTITNRLLTSVVNSYIERITSLNPALALDLSIPARQKEILQAIGLLNQKNGLGSQHEALRQLANRVAAANGGVATSGLVDVGALAWMGPLTEVANLLIDSVGYGLGASRISTVMYSAYVYHGARTMGKQIGAFVTTYKMNLVAKSMAKWSIVTGVGTAIGLFAYGWYANGWTVGSPAFNQGLALMASGIITAVIMATIAAIFPAGTVLVVLIALIDGILIILCQSGDLSDDYICSGITGAFTKAVSFLLYDYTPLADLAVEERIKPTNFKQTLDKVTKGMSVGNKMRLTADVITDLYMNSPTGLGYAYWHQFSDSNLRESTFKYQLQDRALDIHDSLSKNQTSWSHLSDGDKRGTARQSVSLELPFNQAGLNVKMNFYLAEGYKMEAQECFMIWTPATGFVPICYLKDKGDTIHVDLSEDFRYDIFPATLDKFYEQRQSEPNGFSLAWDNSFPTQADFDGDGLRSKAKGGNDPDDSAGDSDADGLSDFWEIKNGYNATQADADNDGLNDYWERFHNTNPRQADTDNDGLLDSEEVFHKNLRTNVWEGGWEIIYAFGTGNRPKKTLVTSDPLNPDTDGDGILDKLEKVYGFHPRLPSKLNVLSIQSQVNNPNATLPNLVAPGQTLVYTATIDNHLRDRYALGLLELDFPVAVQNSSVAAKTYQLTPNQQTTIKGQVTVRSDIAASQQVTLTNRAGANIANLRAEADGRVLWLHLNENSGATRFADHSLLNHHATCSGSRCPTAGQAGYVGQALKFDGSNDYVTVAHHKDLDFNTTGFTVMTWVKASSWTGDPAIISNKNWGSGNREGFVLAANSDRSKWKFNIGDGTNRIDVDGKPINDNQWHHLAVTVQRVGSSTTVTAYHDGVQVAQSSKDLTNINTSHPINMAQDGTGSYGHHFPGLIDEVEIYPRALNPFEMAERFKEPLFHAKFDGNLNDSSIYSNIIQNPSDSNRRPAINSSGGVVGGYVNFNGKTHLQTPATNHFNLNLSKGRGEFTLAAWVKPSAGNDTLWRGVLGRSYSSSAYPTLLIKDRKIRVGFNNGSGLCQTESRDNVLTQGQWSHVVTVFDTSTSPNTFRFYINGQEVPNTTPTACGSVIPPSSVGFWMGRQTEQGQLHIQRLYVEWEDDGSGNAEVKLHLDDKLSDYIWYHGDVDAWTNYPMNLYRPIVSDGRRNLILCENDGSKSKTCGGADDVMIHPGQATFSNLQPGNHSYRYHPDITGSRDGIGTLYWNVTNHNYNGGLDEARVYGYAMNVEEVQDLYNGTLRALELRFDESPRRTQFQDSSGNNLTATCSGNRCPDSGIPGRSNQALRFDGTDDSVTISNMSAPQGPYTLAAWVKFTGSDTSGYNTIMEFGDDAPLFSMRNGKLSLWQRAEGGTVPINKWVHVAATWDGSRTRLYIDGAEVANSSGRAPTGGRGLGIGRHVGDKAWKGLIDQVTVIQKGLSAAEVQALMQESPVLNLHLDEKLGTTTFIDDSPNANNATCTGNACPKAGSKGWMREGLVFDGVDDVITVPDSNTLDLNRFTIGMWVKPIHKKDQVQRLITKESSAFSAHNYIMYLDKEQKVFFGFTDNTCALGGVMTEQSNNALIENQWNHVMMTYNGQKVVLYINGTPDKEKAFTGNLCQNNAPIKIGSANTSLPFAGQMDELVIYGQPLSYRAVKALYDYQVAWFDSIVSHNITLDADKPSVALALDVTHIAKKDIVMAIQASDKTSHVEKVEYNINGGAWQTASRDRDAWTFTYSPSAEGAQTINVRATDSVGHQNTSSKSVTVDHTAPTVTLDPAYTSGTSRTDKSVQLHGTVNDTSSGVRDVYVELLDRAGQSVSAPRLATITSSTWRVTHTLAFPPTGQYTVRLVATDKVGNTKNSVVGTTSRQQSEEALRASGLQLDNYAPQADIISTGPQTTTISGSASLPTIAGTISDVPTPNNALLHYHFEEASGATSFRDSSGNFLHGTCSACPTVNSSGKYGKAAIFDGRNDYIRIASGTALNNSIGQLRNNLTVMAWVKPNRVTGLQRIVSSSLFKSSNNGFGLALNGAGLRFTTYGHRDFDSTTIALSTGRWYHLAAVMDASGNVSFYVDGVFKEKISHSSSASINTDDEFLIGSFDGYDGSPGFFEQFQGEIDEVIIYGNALSSEQIYAVANPTSSGVAQAQINFRHAKDRSLDDGLLLDMPFEEPSGSTLFGDISTNRLSGTCTTCPTSGESGKFGKALRFDGSDDSLILSNPEQLASDKDLTWAAWVKTSADGTLIAKAPATGNWAQGGKTLFIRSGSLAFDVGWVGALHSSAPINDNQWHHVALTVDFEQAGTNDKATLYVDGGQVASKQDWNVNSFSEANLALKIGHTADNFPTPSLFNGLIDEVRIYNRALSGDEIAALYKETWQGVTLSTPNSPFSTWSYQLPAGIEGPHQIHLRTVDGKGNTSMKSNLWTGEVDTQAPRVTLNIQNLGSRFRYTTEASDYNQSELAFNSPCGVGTISSRQYVTDAWYTALFGSTAGSDKKLYRLNASCESAATTLNEVGTLGGLGTTNKVAVAGNHAYVASQAAGLRVVDISSPNSPREVGSYVNSSSKAKGVDIEGNHAYVAHHNLGLLILDITTSSPRLVGTYDTPDSALNVTVVGNYAYVADDKSGLQIIDISNPAAPRLASAIDTPGRAQDVTISGNYAYVADWDQGLQVIKIENPAAATLVGAIDTPGAALGVAVTGSHAYLAAHNQGLQVIDISNPTSPTLITTLGDLTSPHDVEITGDLAYVAGYSDGLYIVNISNPSSPAHIGGTGTPGYVRGVALAGSHAYLAADTGGLRIISLTSNTPQAVACDVFGNCTTTSLSSRQRELVEAGVKALNPAVNVALEAPLVVENNEPLTLMGLARAETFLRELTISVDDDTIYSQNWENGITNDTIAEVTWTPEGEGEHLLTITASDWLANTATYTQSLTLDTQPPAITLESKLITTNEYDEANVVELYGSAIDGGGIEQVEVEIEGVGSLSPVEHGLVENSPNNWSALWHLGADNPPDGVHYTVHITATDVANRRSAISEQILIDAVPPAPVTPTLSYQGNEGVTQVITAGTTIDDVLNPTLTVEWTESSDHSGLSSYLVEWVNMDTQQVLASEEVTEPRRATFTASEALKLAVRISSRDLHGNQTTNRVEPIYIDYAHTPVYVSWDEQAAPYRGWMENACNLIGTDYRLDDNRSELAALQETQQFYSSWDANGLRLAWTGADWQQEGDLFIYLDSKEGGSVRAYNPYTDTLDNTIVLLPLRPTVEEEEKEEEEDDTVTQMGADYLIWVQEDDDPSTSSGHASATLMRWDEDTQQWVAVEEQWLYAFDANIKTTDIYLPFALLGIENPEESSLAMVALATEEDALRIWSTMPQGNSVNSELVAEFLPEGIQAFMFNKRYEWPALTPGLCPAEPFAGDQVELFITLEPKGIVYQTMADNLIEVQDDLFGALADWGSIENELCEANPEDAECERDPDQEEARLAFDAGEELWERMDVEHAALGDQQPFTVTLRLVNRSPKVAEGLKIELYAWGLVTLPEGESEAGKDGEEFSTQHLALDMLESGTEHTFTVHGITDFSRASDGDWVILEGYLTSNNSEELEQKLDWLYVNYELDQEGPSDLSILSPEKFLAAGENTLSGIVIDRSAVPSLMLEVQNEVSGRQNSQACHDPEANDNQWSCTVDIGQANEGETVNIRVKATDEHGHESEWSDWHDFMVDNSPPSIALDSDTELAISDGLIGPEELIISGVLTDNRLVSEVDVCQTADDQQTCQSATVTTSPISDTTYIYEEQPETAISINSTAVCESGSEIVRTFNVAESFTIANVEVGLNIAHPVRYDLNAYLTSPAGTKVTLVSKSDGKNLDVLLSNGAILPIEEDEASEHDLEAPFYDNLRYPFEDLDNFEGENATGAWQLTICDTYPQEDDGTYHHSRLILSTDRLPENSQATWQYELPIEEYEAGSQQTLAIIGVDSVGNRSEPVDLTFTVDNTPPVINANVPSSLSLRNGELSLTGEATDESGIQQVQLNIQDPNGQTVGDLITTDASLTTWIYTDTTPFTQEGIYSIWIEAQDQAGNRSEVGPFEMTVTAPQQIYLPLVSSHDPSAIVVPNAPDLVLGGDTLITVTNAITPTMMQIFNVGTMSVTHSFRVDLYFDPTPAPQSGQKWDQLSQHGGYWLVEQPIAPSESITLTLDSLAAGSNYPASFDGLTHYYIQLDTQNEVSETHELNQALPDNNIVEGSWIEEEEDEEEGGD